MSTLSCSLLFPPFYGRDFGKESPTFSMLLAPMEALLPHLTPLESGSNRPLDFTFDFQVRALVYYHTERYTSAQDLLQAAGCDPFARHLIVPEKGLGESTFYEANATRVKSGLELDRINGLELDTRDQVVLCQDGIWFSPFLGFGGDVGSPAWRRCFRR